MNEINEKQTPNIKDLEEKYQAIIEGKDMEIEAYKKDIKHLIK